MLKIESEFTPKGDQPTAIKQLLEGLEDGYRFQTLLGATGTGKSVAWDEPVTVHLGEDQYYRGAIGQLLDQALGQQQTEEHLELPPPGTWRVLAWNSEDGTIDWQAIMALSRHRSPDTMYKLQTTCGRSVTVTGDHSVWVLRAGQLRLLPGDQVKEGDAMPVPRHIPEPKQPLGHLNILEILGEANTLSVDVRVGQTRDGFVQTINDHYPNAYAKHYAIQNNLKGHRVSLKTATALLTREIMPLEELQIRGTRYGLKALLELSIPLGFVFGQYIAEGHAAGRYALISVRNPEVQHELEQSLLTLEIPFFRRQDGDFVIGARVWRDVLYRLMGGLAGNKHLPNVWAAMSNAVLSSMLRGYFEGDGGMDRGAVSAVTQSVELASDLNEALLRFGIWARTRSVQKRKPNGEMGTYQKITISGRENLECYRDQIGFISKRKKAGLESAIATSGNGNTNVDLIFGVGSRLLLERQQKGLSQKEIAVRANCKRTMISAIELGKRNPSRTLFARLCVALEITDLAFLGLANIHWSPLECVKDGPASSEFVYDFSVEGFETFLTGRGGVFVHNTYTAAKIIEATQRPALIIAPNKVLTAQLAGEFRDFFPSAAVEFFVSYYDYYQPEAYVPGKDLFIEKDAAINQEIERLRHSTTRSLLTRSDVIVVASVSCIYGLGNPEEYRKMNLFLETGKQVERDEILERLVTIQYERNDIELMPGRFRAKGDVLEIWPSYDEKPMRLELWGNDLERLTTFDFLTGEVLEELKSTIVYPAKHYVMEAGSLQPAIEGIEAELKERLEYFNDTGKLLEAQRIKERTLYDLEMLKVLGYCSGIENYSRHIDGRAPGSRPYTLLDYFPDNFITFLDESHISHSQIGGMYKGDYSRKKTLADYGFRLPSCLDNRPLRHEEFYDLVGQVIYVSATPGEHERTVSSAIVDQVIRPTGLIDPKVEVRPTKGQVEDLLGLIRARAEVDERVLITTLTKRMSEDLTEYLVGHGIKARYLHSEIDTVERQEIIRDLRLGHFDALVGINLLREGLDLPEVSLVAILDADKPGFLRSERSLIQTIGRAARNVNGTVILYGDSITPAMQYAISETNRRRDLQMAYNIANDITPTTISKSIRKVIRGEEEAPELEPTSEFASRDDILARITDLELDMWQASEDMDFEKAAIMRDEIRKLEAKLAGKEVKTSSIPGARSKGRSRGRR